MRKLKTKKTLVSLFTLFLLVFTIMPCLQSFAAEYTMATNSSTGYIVVIDDEADLLTTEEEKQLSTVMYSMTTYGNVALKTTNSNSSTTSYLADSFYETNFGSANGTLLVIDMDNREIILHNGGQNRRVITSSYCDSITDNVYRYASNGDYYTCSAKVFEQCANLLNGQRIAQPMKYICNAFLAVIFALFITYFWVRLSSSTSKASKADLTSNIAHDYHFENPNVMLVNTTKTYSPQSSGSSGGGSHHSSGGHSGGGHSSGGGSHHSSSSGGHRF